MALNKALAILACSILLVSAIMLVAPVKAEPSTEPSSLANFTLQGWVWSLDYAQNGIGDVNLTVTNGQVTYNSAAQTWSFFFPNSQLTFAFMNLTTQTYTLIQTFTINLTGSESRTILHLGELDYPTRSDFSGVWLNSDFIAIWGYINLPPVVGGVLNSTSPFFFAMSTPNVNIPLITSYQTGDFSAGINTLINNIFYFIQGITIQISNTLRTTISSVLYELTYIFEKIREQINPFIP